MVISVWTVFINGLIVPAASLVIMFWPIMFLRHAYDSMEEDRFLWLPIAVWAIAWLIPVSISRS